MTSCVLRWVFVKTFSVLKLAETSVIWHIFQAKMSFAPLSHTLILPLLLSALSLLFCPELPLTWIEMLFPSKTLLYFEVQSIGLHMAHMKQRILIFMAVCLVMLHVKGTTNEESNSTGLCIYDDDMCSVPTLCLAEYGKNAFGQSNLRTISDCMTCEVWPRCRVGWSLAVLARKGASRENYLQ